MHGACRRGRGAAEVGLNPMDLTGTQLNILSHEYHHGIMNIS